MHTSNYRNYIPVSTYSQKKNVKKVSCEVFVLFQFNYCVPIYFPVIDEMYCRIQKIQNECIRFSYGVQ